MRLFVIALLAILIFGCVQQTPPVGNDSDTNNTDTNDFDDFDDLNVSKDGNTISLNLDTNRLILNFHFNFNSPNLDVNVLTSSCNVACDALDSNKWSVKKDLNNAGVYACYCTFTACREVDEGSQITRYCADNQRGFLFESLDSNVNQEVKVDFAIPKRLFGDINAMDCGMIFEGGLEPSTQEQTASTFSCLTNSFSSCTNAKGLHEAITIEGDTIVTFVQVKSLDENANACSVLVNIASNDRFGIQGNFEKKCGQLDTNYPFSSCAE